MPELSGKDQREARKWLLKMLDRPDLHEEGLRSWMKDRPDRAAYYAHLMDGVTRATDGARAADMKPSRSADASSRRPWLREMRWGGATAMVACASLVVFAGLEFSSGYRRGGDAKAVELRRFATRVGEVRPEHLSDGTVMTLDTGTVVEVALGPKQRRAILKSGRARFDVPEAPGQIPFSVQNGGNSIAVRSGTFDVSDRAAFMALVVSGTAQVERSNAVYVSQDPAPVRLVAGEKLILGDGQTARLSAIPARRSDLQWVGGVESFDEVPIREVIAEANTYSDIQIVLADPYVGEREITAELHIRDIEAVARALADYLGMRIDRSQSGKLIIVSSN